MPSIVITQATGLYTSNNSLVNPPGSLNVGKNIIIRRDGVMEPRRGFKLYGSALYDASERAKQLFSYRKRLLRHSQSILDYDSDGNGNFKSFSGSFNETEPGLRVKSIESNGNLYFTTDAGIKKLSSYDAAGLGSASITYAGGVKSIDLTGHIKYDPTLTTGWFLQDSAVAYRTVWGTKDANNNLILGAPSQRLVLTNPQMNLMLGDFISTLSALDNITDTSSSSRINDGNYLSTLSLSTTATPNELKSKLVSLCSKLDNDIVYACGTSVSTTGSPSILIGGIGSSVSVTASIATLTEATSTLEHFSNLLTTGSQIEIAGLTGSASVLNGTQTVLTVGSNSIQFLAGSISTLVSTGVSLSTSIKSNKYRSLVTPPDPSIPATNDELSAIQFYLNDIITLLQLEPPSTLLSGTVISQLNQTNYIDPLGITNTATTLLNISIPNEVTSSYFIQIYRSSLMTATGTAVLSDLTPNDELQLVYEAYPTTAELAAKLMVVEDITPESFRGANLYTNPSSGEGITQANDIPPFAKDVNRFKNTIFYANTKTKNRQFLTLLGVVDMIEAVNTGSVSSISITSSLGSQSYTFIKGQTEVTDITCTNGTSLSGKTIDLYSANDETQYRLWYNTGSTSAPVAPTKTLIQVLVNTSDADTVVAQKTMREIVKIINDFTATVVGNKITITNSNEGYTTDATVPTGFVYSISRQGIGENATLKQVLLSSVLSLASAIDNTTKSLIRVINRNPNENVYAYYLSGATDVPGKFLLEARNTKDPQFHTIANNAATGGSFNPNLTTVQYSENETKQNRVYYSKLQQPESVPITNYFDVGSEDKPIYRIFPLRDTLFVFKEDGLYRISGETAPFNVALFDSSCILIASDSVSVSNNLVFGWTTQGITAVSESGTQIISGTIYTDIIKLSSFNYPYFKTATFGVGYESDNSYTVFTVSGTSDAIATMGYRFNSLTNSWTTIEKSASCGIIHSYDDKEYLGAGDVSYIEQERKTFTRTDYADREITTIINSSSYVNNIIKVTTPSQYAAGDVVVQNQYITLYDFNMLLKKLDIDNGTSGGYYLALNIGNGENLRDKITALATKLDLDAKVTFSNYAALIAGYGSTLTNIRDAYNAIISNLNLDPGLLFANYQTLTNLSLQESIITSVNVVKKEIMLNTIIPIYAGEIVIYKSIPIEIIYSPLTMGDPMGLKHLREATIMFENKAFTSCVVSFATDLLPKFESVPIILNGNGIFGNTSFGEGYFGGESHSPPIRTYIPRNCQRCTYLLIRFTHGIAREKFNLFGISVTGEVGVSSRAYR